MRSNTLSDGLAEPVSTSSTSSTPSTHAHHISLSILLLLLVALSGCGQETSTETGAPGDCVRAMSGRSSEGKVDEYLECFTGTLREELGQAREKMKPGEFADLLRQRSAPVRGFAIMDEETTGDDTARLKVEWVFEDRNEIQQFVLRKIKGQWKIAEMTGAQYSKPEIPYGTEVY